MPHHPTNSYRPTTAMAAIYLQTVKLDLKAIRLCFILIEKYKLNCFQYWSKINSNWPNDSSCYSWESLCLAVLSFTFNNHQTSRPALQALGRLINITHPIMSCHSNKFVIMAYPILICCLYYLKLFNFHHNKKTLWSQSKFYKEIS